MIGIPMTILTGIGIKIYFGYMKSSNFVLVNLDNVSFA